MTTTAEPVETAPYPLTDDNSRTLGVGERLVGDVYVSMEGTAGDAAREWFRLNPNDPLYGREVPDDAMCFYRVLLPDAGMTSYTTGAVRNKQEGRGRFDLIPYEAMLALAKRLEFGATIYGDRNWEKGMPLSRFLSSMRRHAMQVNFDFSEDHVAAVLFNAAGFVTTASRIEAGLLPRELDDIGYLAKAGGTK